MAKNRNQKKHFKRKVTIPMAVVLGFVPIVSETWTNIHSDIGWDVTATLFSRSLTGWDGLRKEWSLANTKNGAIPIAIGFLVHILATKLGVNRMLSSAGIPFIRI